MLTGLISLETFEQSGDLPILGQFGDFDRIGAGMRCDASDPVGIPENQFRSRNHRCMRPTWVRLIILGDLEERCVIPWSTSRTADFVLRTLRRTRVA